MEEKNEVKEVEEIQAWEALGILPIPSEWKVLLGPLEGMYSRENALQKSQKSGMAAQGEQGVILCLFGHISWEGQVSPQICNYSSPFSKIQKTQFLKTHKRKLTRPLCQRSLRLALSTLAHSQTAQKKLQLFTIFSPLFRRCTSQFSLGLVLVAQICDLSLLTNLGKKKSLLA